VIGINGLKLVAIPNDELEALILEK
jgi:hypothetical protein